MNRVILMGRLTRDAEMRTTTNDTVGIIMENNGKKAFSEEKNHCELTVTITLNEYRDLLKVKDTHEYEKEKIKDAKWKAEQKVKELTTENEKLRHQLLTRFHAQDENAD